MPLYKVEVEVIQSYELEVEADSHEDAEEIAHATYYIDGIIVDELVNQIDTDEIGSDDD